MEKEADKMESKTETKQNETDKKRHPQTPINTSIYGHVFMYGCNMDTAAFI